MPNAKRKQTTADDVIEPVKDSNAKIEGVVGGAMERCMGGAILGTMSNMNSDGMDTNKSFQGSGEVQLCHGQREVTRYGENMKADRGTLSSSGVKKGPLRNPELRAKALAKAINSKEDDWTENVLTLLDGNRIEGVDDTMGVYDEKVFKRDQYMSDEAKLEGQHDLCLKGKCDVFDGSEVKDLVLGEIDQGANKGEHDAMQHYYDEFEEKMNLESTVELPVLGKNSEPSETILMQAEQYAAGWNNPGLSYAQMVRGTNSRIGKETKQLNDESDVRRSGKLVLEEQD